MWLGSRGGYLRRVCLGMADDQCGDAIVTALEVEHLVVAEPDRLAGARLLDDRYRLAGVDIEGPDLGALFVAVKGVGGDL